jgi:hypothetical protein
MEQARKEATGLEQRAEQSEKENDISKNNQKQYVKHTDSNTEEESRDRL